MYKARAYAKANLSLNVVGLRGDFHTLDMLNVSVDLYDEITLTFRDDDKVTFKIEASEQREFSPQLFTESVKRILPKFTDAYNISGVDVEIVKNIPSGGGFGGSSAINAAFAKLIANAKGEEAATDFLLELGSDVPFVYKGGAQRVQGVGEVMQPVQIPELYLLLVKPKGGVFTKECYKTYDEVGTEGKADIENLIAALNAGDMKAANDFAYNQLSESAEKLNPEIAKVKKQLSSLGAEFVIMTGSGSGVSAVFNDKEQAEKIEDKLSRKLWSKVAKIVDFGVETIK